MSQAARPGFLTWVVALAMPVAVGLAAAAASFPGLIGFLRERRFDALVLGAAAGFGVVALLGLAAGLMSQRRPRGAPGRLRASMLGFSTALMGVSLTGLVLVLRRAAPSLPPDTMMSLEEALLLLPDQARALLGACSVGAVLSAVVALGSEVSLWWLIPQRGRRVIFGLIDVALLAGTIVAWLPLFTHEDVSESVAHEAARLSLTFLFGVRLGARALPMALDLLENVNFRWLVASRHLRAKKSGFLAAISFLSILAVSVSTCALTVVLSVMGGFRQDLKRKILGNNAHIVVDTAQDRLANYEAMSAQIRAVPGVRGVSPYVSGEVMISSASNLGGAVLRGIDVAHIGEVSELPSNMKMGSLDYLVHPEKLARLPSSQLGLALGMPTVSHGATDSDAKPPPKDTERVSDAIKRALDDSTPPPASAGPTLPGIVVGQELARSLRLYLGDEVNVVTPLGDLGPTGPMPKSRPFRVAGIFYSGMYEYDMKFAYVTLASAQRFLNAGERATGIEVTVREPERAQEIAKQIEARLKAKGLRVRAWQELNKNLFGALALEKLAMFITLGIAILVASFCIFATLTLMVQEKGREVAVLKAMGAADRAIVRIFVLEGMLIGLWGSLLGLGMGYVVSFAFDHFGVRLNPEVYYIDRLPVHIDPSEFLTTGVAAVAVCLLVTIYPAKLASRLRPVEALRYE